jgi:hypothetical protein
VVNAAREAIDKVNAIFKEGARRRIETSFNAVVKFETSADVVEQIKQLDKVYPVNNINS